MRNCRPRRASTSSRSLPNHRATWLNAYVGAIQDHAQQGGRPDLARRSDASPTWNVAALIFVTLVSTQQLMTAVDRVRSLGSSTLKSNYFFGQLRETEFPLWATDRSLIFLTHEHDFRRVYFMSGDVDDLSQALGDVSDRPLVADYVAREDDHDVVEATFRNAGFARAAVYQRMVNPHLAATRPRAMVTRAELEEVDALHRRLCQHFDVRLDHIPERDQFTELARRGQVLVHRRDRDIDGYVVYQLHGRRAHLNYWYSQPGAHPAVAVLLLGAFFTDMTARSINASFLWVQTRKRNEIGVYRRLGYTPDGLVSHVYIKE